MPINQRAAGSSSPDPGGTVSSSEPKAHLTALDAVLEKLEAGELIPATDNRTADGEAMWLGQEPAYHELDVVAYTKTDAQEWAGRARKYKLEIVQQADRFRRLETEVNRLKQQLEDQMNEINKAEEDAEVNVSEMVQGHKPIVQLRQKAISLRSEIAVLQRHQLSTKKQMSTLKDELSTLTNRMGYLLTEMEASRKRYENSLGEKEKLRLEREWFFRERIMLEETTVMEESDAVWDEIRGRLQKLRHSMHRAWLDAKRDDVRGGLRAAKVTTLTDSWYTSRRRMYNVRDMTNMVPVAASDGAPTASSNSASGDTTN